MHHALCARHWLWTLSLGGIVDRYIIDLLYPKLEWSYESYCSAQGIVDRSIIS